MAGWFAPIKGKCTWWREAPHDDDVYNAKIEEDSKRVVCMCMVEGRGWTFTNAEVPEDCPDHRKCRYYIKSG